MEECKLLVIISNDALLLCCRLINADSSWASGKDFLSPAQLMWRRVNVDVTDSYRDRYLWFQFSIILLWNSHGINVCSLGNAHCMQILIPIFNRRNNSGHGSKVGQTASTFYPSSPISLLVDVSPNLTIISITTVYWQTFQTPSEVVNLQLSAAFVWCLFPSRKFARTSQVQTFNFTSLLPLVLSDTNLVLGHHHAGRLLQIICIIIIITVHHCWFVSHWTPLMASIDNWHAAPVLFATCAHGLKPEMLTFLNMYPILILAISYFSSKTE